MGQGAYSDAVMMKPNPAAVAHVTSSGTTEFSLPKVAFNGAGNLSQSSAEQRTLAEDGNRPQAYAEGV